MRAKSEAVTSQRQQGFSHGLQGEVRLQVQVQVVLPMRKWEVKKCIVQTGQTTDDVTTEDMETDEI